MKRLYPIFFSMLLLLMAVSGCSSNNAAKQQKQVQLTVSAAASLQNALNDIKAAFSKQYPNITINYNFGASGALQQQISQGAPVDLFFSADENHFNKLVHAGQINKQKGTDLIGNQLVLIVPKDSHKGIESFPDLTKADKISIGTPESVPAGQYGKETLESFHVWKPLEGKVVYGKDVRQVLTYVETGNVDAGLVYKTDALTSSKVKIVATAQDHTHAPIIYPAGIIKNSSHPKEAQLFYHYLHSQTSMKILERYGFKGLS